MSCLSNKEKFAHFWNRNLCERMSCVGESWVTYVTFGSSNTCINRGFMKEKRSFFLAWCFRDRRRTRQGRKEKKRKRKNWSASKHWIQSKIFSNFFFLFPSVLINIYFFILTNNSPNIISLCWRSLWFWANNGSLVGRLRICQLHLLQKCSILCITLNYIK